MTIPLTDEVIGYIGRYGGFCRDCADENGVCPTSGLPCAGREKAIRHVINAYNYGVKHGFLGDVVGQSQADREGNDVER